MDLLSTRLSKATSGHDCYYCFYIDKYQYSYIQKDERYSISYYLSLTSKNLIGALELEPFPGEVKSKQITLKSLSCTVSKNKESELFPIKIEFNKIDLASPETNQKNVSLELKINTNYPIINEHTEVSGKQIIASFSKELNIEKNEFITDTESQILE